MLRTALHCIGTTHCSGMAREKQREPTMSTSIHSPPVAAHLTATRAVYHDAAAAAAAGVVVVVVEAERTSGW